MNNKIIFLDIDGVLVTAGSRWSFEAEPKFHPAAVENLNMITDATGAKLVMSSMWRVGRSLPNLRRILKRNGVTGELIGKTPEYGYEERQEEILDYLEENPCSRWICIDDDESIVRQNLIHTSWTNGLENYHASVAIRRLSSTAELLSRAS